MLPYKSGSAPREYPDPSLDWEEIEKLGVKLFTAPLLSDSSEYARHDPDLLAKAILELWRKEGRRTVNSRR